LIRRRSDASRRRQRAIGPTPSHAATHLYGMACDLDPILALAKLQSERSIEDCCIRSAKYKGQMVGTHGDRRSSAFRPLNVGGGLT
jgi:dTDP-4-amino-4,6-dideoxygalactose transaminase